MDECKGKTRYENHEKARAAALIFNKRKKAKKSHPKNGLNEPYWCAACRGYHIGRPARNPKNSRGVTPYEKAILARLAADGRKFPEL